MSVFYCSVGDTNLKDAAVIGPEYSCIFRRLSSMTVTYVGASGGPSLPAFLKPQDALLWQSTFENTLANPVITLNTVTNRYVILFVDPTTMGDPTDIKLLAVPEYLYNVVSSTYDVVPMYNLLHRNWTSFQIRTNPVKLTYISNTNVSTWDAAEYYLFHFNTTGRSNMDYAIGQGFFSATNFPEGPIDISGGGVLGSNLTTHEAKYSGGGKLNPLPTSVRQFVDNTTIPAPTIFTVGLSLNRLGVYKGIVLDIDPTSSNPFSLTTSPLTRLTQQASDNTYPSPLLGYVENNIGLSANQNGVWFLNQAYTYIQIAMNFYVVDQITYIGFAQINTDSTGTLFSSYTMPAEPTYIISQGLGGTGLHTPLYPKINTSYPLSKEDAFFLYDNTAGFSPRGKFTFEGYNEGYIWGGYVGFGSLIDALGYRYPGQKDYGYGGLFIEAPFISQFGPYVNPDAERTTQTGVVLDTLGSPQKYLFSGGHFPLLTPPVNGFDQETSVYADIAQDAYVINPNGLLQSDKLWIDYNDYYVRPINEQLPGSGELRSLGGGLTSSSPFEYQFSKETFFANLKSFMWYPGINVFQLAFDLTGTASGINMFGAIYVRFSDGITRKFGIEANTPYDGSVNLGLEPELDTTFQFANIDGNSNESYQPFTTYIRFPDDLSAQDEDYDFSLYANADGSLEINHGDIKIFTGTVHKRPANWTFMDDKAGYCSDLPRAYPCDKDGNQIDILKECPTGLNKTLKIYGGTLVPTGEGTIAISSLFDTYGGGWVPGNDGDFGDYHFLGQVNPFEGADHARPQYPRPGAYGMDLSAVPVNTLFSPDPPVDGAPNNWWAYRATEGWFQRRIQTFYTGEAANGFLDPATGFYIYFRYFSRPTANKYQSTTTQEIPGYIEVPPANTPLLFRSQRYHTPGHDSDGTPYGPTTLIGIQSTHASSLGGYFNQFDDCDRGDSLEVVTPNGNVLDWNMFSLLIPGDFPGSLVQSQGYPTLIAPFRADFASTNGGQGGTLPIIAYSASGGDGVSLKSAPSGPGRQTYAIPVSTAKVKMVIADTPNCPFTALVAKFDIISGYTGEAMRYFRVESLPDYQGNMHQFGSYIPGQVPSNAIVEGGFIYLPGGEALELEPPIGGWIKGVVHNWQTNLDETWIGCAVGGPSPGNGVTGYANTNPEVFDPGLPCWPGPPVTDIAQAMSPYIGGALYHSNIAANMNYQAFQIGFPDHYYTVNPAPAYALRWFCTPTLTMEPVIDSFLRPPGVSALGVGPNGAIIKLTNYAEAFTQNYGAADAAAIELTWVYRSTSLNTEVTLDNSGNQLSKAALIVTSVNTPNFSTYPLASHPVKDTAAYPPNSATLNSQAGMNYAAGWQDATTSIINSYIPVKFCGNSKYSVILIGTGQASDPTPFIIDDSGGQEQKAVLGVTVDSTNVLFAIESSTGNLIKRDGPVGTSWQIVIVAAIPAFDSVLLLQEQTGIITCIHGSGTTVSLTNMYTATGTKISGIPITNFNVTTENDMTLLKYPSFAIGAKAF